MALCPAWALAQEYDKLRLVGDWYEVAQTPTLLEQDCHGTTASVATRQDTRLTLKIACRKGSLTGNILPIDGVLVETAPAAFSLRLVHLSDFGTVNLVVLWQAPDDSMAAIGGTRGEVGW
ncbi:MAG: lipocalin family protein, partial [Pseudorhodobacter sp.]|nr:lipocalin family protein [Pseudorhodobacter sp.]